MTLQQIQKYGDYSCIDQISEHGTDDWNDEEGLDGIAVFIADSTHVGHRIGSRTKAEATDACTQDGSIIIAPQQGEGNKVGKEVHHCYLG